jgi:hypothetical protein
MRPVPWPPGSHDPVGNTPVILHDVPPLTVVVKYEYPIDVKLLFQNDAMATPRVAVNI